MTAPSPHDDLAAMVRRGLLPQRFPIRRDVDFHAGVAAGAGPVSFYDNHWLDGTVLAASCVRIASGGIEGALIATAFRQLLRAALAIERDPGAALAACLQVSRPPGIAAAVVTLDTGDGSLLSTAIGEAMVAVVPDGAPSGSISPGDIVWIAAGDIAPPAATRVPHDDLEALVSPALARPAAGCAAAVLFKGKARTDDSATFKLPNDAAAIPAFLRDIQHFLASREICEEDAAGVDVALDELLTNTISYAFADGQAHEILVAPTLEGQQLVIEIRDDGSPFDPLGVPPPDLSGGIDERVIGGLGMHFVRTIMDEVAYRRSSGWNVLTLRKKLTGSRLARETLS